MKHSQPHRLLFGRTLIAPLLAVGACGSPPDDLLFDASPASEAASACAPGGRTAYTPLPTEEGSGGALGNATAGSTGTSPAICGNSELDAGETDVDCGGLCAPCRPDSSCSSSADCDSGVCIAAVCQHPRCGDGVQNQVSEACDGDGLGNGGETPSCNADCSVSRCGDGIVNAQAGESCDDGNDETRDDCPSGPLGTCQPASCSDGFLHDLGSGTELHIDCGDAPCLACPGEVLLSELTVTPATGEFIELYNPGPRDATLELVHLADYPSYHLISSGGGKPSSTDFRVRFPKGAMIPAGGFVVVAVGSASAFMSTYGRAPDFDLDPLDPLAPAMLGEYGLKSGLTNSNEMVVAFAYTSSMPRVYDIDYILYGSATNAVDKTDVAGYLPDTPASAQSFAKAPETVGRSLSRCSLSEGMERRSEGNGLLGHDETSEDHALTWQLTKPATPGFANGCLP